MPPTPDQNSRLPTLPLESLVFVKTLLPLCSIATLVLCNGALLFLFRHQTLSALKSRSQGCERNMFLIMFQKIVPQYLLRHNCDFFHQLRKTIYFWR